MKTFVRILALVLITYAAQCAAFGQTQIEQIKVFVTVNEGGKEDIGPIKKHLERLVKKQRGIRLVNKRDDADICLGVIASFGNGKWDTAFVLTQQVDKLYMLLRFRTIFNSDSLDDDCQFIVEQLMSEAIVPLQHTISAKEFK